MKQGKNKGFQDVERVFNHLDKMERRARQDEYLRKLRERKYPNKNKNETNEQEEKNNAN